MRALPKEGSVQARSYHFRPPDPTWVSAKMLEEVRAALRAFDPYVTIWWSETKRCVSHPEMPGRWRVMEYLPRKNNWLEAFTWETPSKGYRLPWPASAIIHKLGQSMVRMDVASRLADEFTQKTRAAEKAEFYSSMDEWMRDQAERTVGSRATPRSILHATSETEDGIRRRAHARGGMFRRDARLSNHEKFLLEHFKKQRGDA